MQPVIDSMTTLTKSHPSPPKPHQPEPTKWRPLVALLAGLSIVLYSVGLIWLSTSEYPTSSAVTEREKLEFKRLLAKPATELTELEKVNLSLLKQRYELDTEGNVLEKPHQFVPPSDETQVSTFDIENPSTFIGAAPSDIRDWLLSNGWYYDGLSKRGNGEKYRNGIFGEQIRIMPGYPSNSRPDPLKHGLYLEISRKGSKRYYPLLGNPSLKAGSDDPK